MRKSFPLLILCSIVLVNLSCQSGARYDFERKNLTVNNQQFEILTAWRIFDDYIKTNGNYRKDIFNRIKTEFHGAQFPFLFDAIQTEIEPDEELKEEIRLMKMIDFAGIVESTYQIVTEELPGPATKILFIPANPAHREFYKEFGIAFHAFTLGAGKIIVSFDPTFDNWQKFLPYALAHEYHHSIWTSRNFETANLTPLEYIVLEGRADSFANELFPNTSHPFINKLEKDDEERIWNLIKPEMNSRDTDMNEKISYGTNEIPYGSVYTIGFNIVEAYKSKNPNVTIPELIDIAPKDILLGSKYE